MGVKYDDESRKVVNLLEQDDVKENLNYLHKWYVDGIINPDANVVTDAGKGAIFSTGQGWPAAAESWAFGQGIEKYDVTKVFGPLYTTETIQGSMNAVSANSNYCVMTGTGLPIHRVPSSSWLHSLMVIRMLGSR